MQTLSVSDLSESHPQFTREVMQQQFALYLGSVRLAGVIVAFTAGVVALAAYFSGSPSWLALSWYGSLLVVCGVRVLRWHKKRNAPSSIDKLRAALNEGCIFSILIGGLYGLSSVLFFRADDLPFLCFISVVVSGMCAGTAAILNPIPRVTMAYLGAALLPQVVVMTYVAVPLSFAIAALSAAYFLILSAGSLSSYKRFRQLVETSQKFSQAEADLVDAIESTTDAFATFSSDGVLLRANRRHHAWFPDVKTSVDMAHSKEPVQLPNGRWVLGSMRPTRRGGYVSVHTDITALKRREDDLIEARRQAEMADEAKTRFLTTMSHELRTPLNIIIGFARLMGPTSRGRMSTEDVHEFSENIKESGDHLLSLIDDIIDFARVGSDGYQLTCKPVQVTSLLNWCVSMVTRYGEQHNDAQITIDVDDNIDRIVVDETAIRRILVNLIENSLKFSDGVKQVSIEARLVDGKTPVIRVSDNGKGIAAEHVERVFEPFYQVDGRLNRAHEGAGLGLTLARELMGLHGGQISLESELGKGTAVTLRFPPSALSGKGDASSYNDDPTNVYTMPLRSNLRT